MCLLLAFELLGRKWTVKIWNYSSVFVEKTYWLRVSVVNIFAVSLSTICNPPPLCVSAQSLFQLPPCDAWPVPLQRSDQPPPWPDVTLTPPSTVSSLKLLPRQTSLNIFRQQDSTLYLSLQRDYSDGAC